MSGGDEPAMGVVAGLLAFYQTANQFIVVKFRDGEEQQYVKLRRHGLATYQTATLILPYNAAVVQRARDIAAKPSTQWMVQDNIIITVQRYSLQEDSGGV